MTRRDLPVPVEPRRPSRWSVLKTVLVFHIKLGLDGLKDILLSPLSIVAAAAGILLGGDRPHRYLDKLMQAGRAYDDWVDLYATSEPGAPDERGRDNLDAYIGRLQRALAEQKQRGSLSANAKAALENALKALDASKEQRPPRG